MLLGDGFQSINLNGWNARLPGCRTRSPLVGTAFWTWRERERCVVLVLE